jgi:hypothetical protein
MICAVIFSISPSLIVIVEGIVNSTSLIRGLPELRNYRFGLILKIWRNFRFNGFVMEDIA